jgi:hypothetical protein
LENQQSRDRYELSEAKAKEQAMVIGDMHLQISQSKSTIRDMQHKMENLERVIHGRIQKRKADSEHESGEDSESHGESESPNVSKRKKPIRKRDLF